MFRLVLNLCLVIATLLGPMMCCCTLQASTQSAISENVAKASPDSLRRKSCCEVEPPTQEKSKLPAPKPGCPCKKQQLDQGLVTVSNPVGGSVSGSHREVVGYLFADFRLSMLRSNTAPRSRDVDRHVPVRSGRDIITAHHVLTC